jgi:8-oxo-dGTP pyrophosphatase MutT (NUDIX family)
LHTKKQGIFLVYTRAMKKVIQFFRPFIYNGFLMYWYVFRPKTYGAKVIIVCNDEILLIKTTYDYGYSLPGGGLKKGEDPSDAAKREAYEEVGIVLSDVAPITSFITTAEYKIDTVYGFYSEVTSKKYTLDKLEIECAEWYPINNLPKLGSVTQKIINAYITSN